MFGIIVLTAVFDSHMSMVFPNARHDFHTNAHASGWAIDGENPDVYPKAGNYFKTRKRIGWYMG